MTTLTELPKDLPVPADDGACNHLPGMTLPSIGLLATNGVLINLALPTSSNALPGEAELITGKGICYFQIPVAWENPEIDQLRLFCNLLLVPKTALG